MIDFSLNGHFLSKNPWGKTLKNFLIKKLLKNAKKVKSFWWTIDNLCDTIYREGQGGFIKTNVYIPKNRLETIGR